MDLFFQLDKYLTQNNLTVIINDPSGYFIKIENVWFMNEIKNMGLFLENWKLLASSMRKKIKERKL